MEKKSVLNQNCKKSSEKVDQKRHELESKRFLLLLEIVNVSKKSQTNALVRRLSEEKKDLNKPSEDFP